MYSRPSLSSLPSPSHHPYEAGTLQQLGSFGHRSQEVGQQITNGDDTLAPSLLVYYDDSLEPKVREFLEYGLQTAKPEPDVEASRKTTSSSSQTHRRQRVYANVGV